MLTVRAAPNTCVRGERCELARERCSHRVRVSLFERARAAWRKSSHVGIPLRAQRPRPEKLPAMPNGYAVEELAWSGVRSTSSSLGLRRSFTTDKVTRARESRHR